MLSNALEAARRIAASPFVARLRQGLASFSPLGRAVAATSVVAWVVAAATGWREFAVLAGISLVLAVVALASTLGKDELEVELSLAQHRVVVGEAAVGKVMTTNGTGRRASSTVMEVPVGRAVVTLGVPGLSSGESHEDVFVIAADKRAVLEIGPARTVRGDALGLARREVVWTGMTTLFVHPKTVSLPGTTSGWMRDMEGQARTDLSSSDVVFHALRDYVPGDDRRHIHWKTYARTGQLMVRQFVDSRKSELGLVLSTRLAEYSSPEEFEIAVSVVGSLGLSALAEQQEVVCVAGKEALPAFNRQRLLDGLADVECDDREPDVLTAVQRGRVHTKRASVVLVVSGGVVNPAVLRAAADRCGSHARVIAIQVAAGHAPSSRQIGLHTLLTLGSLNDLYRLTRTLVA